MVQDDSQPSHMAWMPHAGLPPVRQIFSLEGSTVAMQGWGLLLLFFGRAQRSLHHLGHRAAPGPGCTKRVTWMAGQTQTALTRAVTGSCTSIHTDWIPRRSDPQTGVVFVLFLGAAGDMPKFLVKGQ